MSGVTPQGGNNVNVEWYFAGPFKLVFVGLGIGAAAMILGALISGGVFTFLRMLLMLASLMAASGAVWWRLSSADSNDFEEQSKTGILIALASGSVLAAWVAMPSEADSLRMALLVLWVVTLVAVPLILLPRLARRLVFSLLVVYPFCGIVTATTAVPLPNNSMPWLPTLVWNHVYRHYLTFAYFNNAYHFYSPEPGPPTLVWFQVIFEDDNKKEHTYWKRLVRREDFPTRQQYQRFLSLTESVNQPMQPPAAKFATLSNRRGEMAVRPRKYKNSDRTHPPIKVPEQVPIQNQYREPSELARRYLESYAAYVIRTTQHPENPDWKVKSVRVYRITHDLINPGQMVNGLQPTDPTLFYAYYYGEYEYKWSEKQKKMVAELKGSPFEEERDKIFFMDLLPNGKMIQRDEPVRDPMLYWLLPIMRFPKPGHGETTRWWEDYDLYDGLSIHAGEPIKWEK